jgi:hypothetical protein
MIVLLILVYKLTAMGIEPKLILDKKTQITSCPRRLP